MRSAQDNGVLLRDLSKLMVVSFSNTICLRVIPVVFKYYDEVEACNPLGSSSGKYNLGCRDICIHMQQRNYELLTIMHKYITI